MFRQIFISIKVALSISLLFLLPLIVIAQDPAPSPTPTEEERRLDEKTRLLKKKTEYATAQNEYRAAVLQPTATPLEGEAELEDVKVEPEMMTYRAMSTTCHCIATRIKNRFDNADVIVIYDPTAAAGLRHYKFSYPILDARMQAMKARLDNAITNNTPVAGTSTKFKKAITLNFMLGAGGAAALLPAAKDVLRSFADVLAMFRTDTKIEGQTIDIKKKALVAEMLFALNEKYDRKISLYDPGSFSPEEAVAKESNGNFKSQVLQSLLEGYQKRNAVILIIDGKKASIEEQKQLIKKNEALIGKLNEQVPDLEAAVKKAKTKKNKAKADADLADLKEVIKDAQKAIDAAKKKIATIEAEIAPLAELIKDFDALVTELTTVNETFGTNDLITFLKAESLDLVLRDPNDATKYQEYYWLDLSPVTAGGNNRTRKNLITFFGGSKIDHSGGVIVEWQFLDPKWRFVDGGKTQVYEGYLGSKKIRDNRVRYLNADLTTKCGHSDEKEDEKNLAQDNNRRRKPTPKRSSSSTETVTATGP